MRVLALVLYWLLFLPPFLRWSKGTTDAQIDKMQAAAFNSPGAAAPVPPPVILAGLLLLTGHLGLARLMHLPVGQSLTGLLAGSGIATTLVIYTWRRDI